MNSPSKKDPEGIGEILDALKHSTGLGRKLDEAQIWERWPEVVGMRLMPYGRPVGVKNGTLTVEVTSAVWMHKYAYEKGAILHRVNRLTGHEMVTDLFLKLAPDDPADEPGNAT